MLVLLGMTVWFRGSVLSGIRVWFRDCVLLVVRGGFMGLGLVRDLGRVSSCLVLWLGLGVFLGIGVGFRGQVFLGIAVGFKG